MTVYHFTNMQFGHAFLAMWREIQVKAPCSVVVVLSDSGERPTGIRAVWRSLKKRWMTMRVKRMAGSGQVQVNWVKNVNSQDFIEPIAQDSIAICTGFNQIFREELLNAFQISANVHPSVLPWYRGPVPSYWCLKNKEQRSGFSLHLMTTSIDEGPILHQTPVPILPNDTEHTLDQRIAASAAVVFRDYLLSCLQGNLWVKSVLPTENFYSNPVHYRSFPS